MKRVFIILGLYIIGMQVFAQKVKVDGITYKIQNDKALVESVDAKLVHAVIQSSISYKGIDYPVVELPFKFWDDGSPFINHKQLKSVSIPNTIYKIPENAFTGCSNLTTLILPDHPVEIHPLAFIWRLSKNASCNALTEVRCQNGAVPTYALPYLPKDCPFMLTYQSTQVGAPHESLAQSQSKDATAPTVTVPQPKQLVSDVDNLPMASVTDNDNTFAVIFANEHYRREAAVEYAQNDGQMFKKYCESLLGLPARNIHYVEDATFNDFQAELDWLSKVGKAYGKDANIIVYYAGHGIPDEQGNHAYLLPTDGIGDNVNTGYSLNRLYALLSELEAQKITVFLDACFSGSKRGEGMLASARGVAIKTKSESPKGNLVVFSAATSDETAYPFEENGHGLFTYFLLKKLKETSGRCSLGELSDYLTTQVTRHSIVVNSKSQTPCITASPALQNTWRYLKLK